MLVLAGCSGTSGSVADAGWAPPRPTGVTNEKWASVVDADPASLPVEDLAGGYCQAVKPAPDEINAKAQEYPGATGAEFSAFYDYVIEYVAPLCAALPPATGPKGVKQRSAVVVADL